MKTMTLGSASTINSIRQTEDRGKYDAMLPAAIIFPLIIAIWLRVKFKTEIAHCFAIFLSIFAPLIMIALTLESDAPFKEVGAILILIPLGWWIRQIFKTLFFEQ